MSGGVTLTCHVAVMRPDDVLHWLATQKSIRGLEAVRIANGWTAERNRCIGIVVSDYMGAKVLTSSAIVTRFLASEGFELPPILGSLWVAHDRKVLKREV